MPDYDCTAKCLVCGAEAFFSFFLSFLFVHFREIQNFRKALMPPKSAPSRRSVHTLSQLTVHRRAFHFPTLLLGSMQAQRWFETQ